MRKQLIFIEIANAVNRAPYDDSRAVVVPGPDDERVSLRVNGRVVTNMVTYAQMSPSSPGTGVRMMVMVGAPGERRWWPQKKDGSFSWDAIAKYLLLLLRTGGEEMTDEKRVRRLEEIRDEVLELVEEADCLVKGTRVQAHARAYWVPWLRKMVNGDPDDSLQADVDELRREL